MRAVLWAAVRRRRLPGLVIAAVVLLSSATAVLAVGLLVAANAPFDQAFSRQRGAHATASFEATTTGLAATAGAPGVTAAAGPFDAVRAPVSSGQIPLPAGLIVGRDTADSAVDTLRVREGSWLTGPGQIVLSWRYVGGTPGFQIGHQVRVAGGPSLEVVGIADSITGTADAWVWPDQADVLRTADAATSRQMLYRFSAAGSETDVATSLARATAGLPDGALLGSSSYLVVKLGTQERLAPMVPFVVAFAVLGLLLSVLIVVNVVSGAVVAGQRTIGVQKALGFTPAQVVAIFAGQVLLVGVPACLLGTVLGNLLAVPLLARANDAFTVAGTSTIPVWVDMLVLLGVPGLVGLAAAAAAARAGRLPAVQAITIGRAPRAGRGYRIRRALHATRLPRPVSFGLGTPSARPGRSVVTMVAILLGATTVVLAVGLTASLMRVQEGFSRQDAVAVVVYLPGGGEGWPGPVRAESDAVLATIQDLPGTARVVGASRVAAGLAGSPEELEITAYHGDAAWTGYPLISGRWYAGPGEAVAGSRTLRLTGVEVGDHITVTTEGRQRRIHIVGEVLHRVGSASLIMDARGLAGLVADPRPDMFELALTEGTDAHNYVESLAGAAGEVRPQVVADDAANQTIAVMVGLITMLSVALTVVAALGIFNTVVLNTRERVSEIGILKAVGMTPRQVRVMVVTSMAAIGALAGALAVPLGWQLHRWVVPVMAEAAGTGIPGSVLAVYRPLQLVALGACGIALAVLGALVPAGWAARTQVARALRAE